MCRNSLFVEIKCFILWTKLLVFGMSEFSVCRNSVTQFSAESQKNLRFTFFFILYRNFGKELSEQTVVDRLFVSRREGVVRQNVIM